MFQRLKLRSPTALINSVYIKSLLSFALVSAIALLIWFVGPMVTWQNHAPLANLEKRFYIIAAIYLIWMLKFFLFDLDQPNPMQYKDPLLQKLLAELQNRVLGAKRFLKKTKVMRHEKSVRLIDLPVYLMIGPKNSGKTSLLANSGVNFILHRQIAKEEKRHLAPSTSCDWWLTRDLNIIDVPGGYLTSQANSENGSEEQPVWQFFLRLLQQAYGQNHIKGVIITLPLPELMNAEADNVFDTFWTRLHELKKYHQQQIPCYLLITKCDLIPGFKEFFGESTIEEIKQSWGVTLPTQYSRNLPELVIDRFDELIKKLNQQLLWRLHHERNPQARSLIKDFPLQIEKLKEIILSQFTTPFHNNAPKLLLQGIYLTSALQSDFLAEPIVEEAKANNSVQMFKAPISLSRGYFIKHLLSHALIVKPTVYKETSNVNVWQRRLAYISVIIIIGGVSLLLGRDFEHGIKYAYSVQNQVTDYQLAIQPISDPAEHLSRTIAFLDKLQKSTKSSSFKLDVAHILAFYSHKSQQKANALYFQSLQQILLPELGNFFSEYLKDPINKNSVNVYAALKAYIMLSDNMHLNTNFLIDTLQRVLPKELTQGEKANLMQHLQLALSIKHQSIATDAAILQNVQKYFLNMPSFQLAYIILKNMQENNLDSGINLSRLRNNNVFTMENNTPVPNMFTRQNFSNILTESTILAATQAIEGNWVLGKTGVSAQNSAQLITLTEQLKAAYITNYVNVWENVLDNIQIIKLDNLADVDKIVLDLISNDSPLLQLLRTVHDNTYFEPITSSSLKLQKLGMLVEQNKPSENILYQIFSSLQALHVYLQTIITADDAKKAAFQALTMRMQHNGNDAITQLRLIADKTPLPIQAWLQHIADSSWHSITQEAGTYLDISWQDKVMRFYKNDIANRYPFSTNLEPEVTLDKFTEFFGKPGVVSQFYQAYLDALIDTSNQEWRWRQIDNESLAFSEQTLRQIQHALRIQHTFFPNGDNKLNVKFALQPYQFGKAIKGVRLSINGKEIFDARNTKEAHNVAWPNQSDLKLTSVQLLLTNDQIFNNEFRGEWGWFKLVNQAFDTVISKKEFLINLSLNQHPAKYLLFVDEPRNPFLSLNLKHFYFPESLTKLAPQNT